MDKRTSEKMRFFDLLQKSEKSKKAREELVKEHLISFVEALVWSLEDNHNYTLNYCKICVGMVAKQGIKTWWDLMSRTTVQIEAMPRVSKKVKHILIDMKDHEIWNANIYATYATFNNYIGGPGHYKRLMKYFNDNMFLYEQIRKISWEALEGIEGIGPRTIEALKLWTEEHHSTWMNNYMNNLDRYYRYFLELNI